MISKQTSQQTLLHHTHTPTILFCLPKQIAILPQCLFVYLLLNFKSLRNSLERDVKSYRQNSTPTNETKTTLAGYYEFTTKINNNTM